MAEQTQASHSTDLDGWEPSEEEIGKLIAEQRSWYAAGLSYPLGKIGALAERCDAMGFTAEAQRLRDSIRPAAIDMLKRQRLGALARLASDLEQEGVPIPPTLAPHLERSKAEAAATVERIKAEHDTAVVVTPGKGWWRR